ncbi:MAG: 5-(carboxyamino)imidazole ribonucleotide synthase, partial [Comamonadaceae bacterium]
MKTTVDMIAPGQWLGMLGGGQLGRMFCHAAQSLGYKVAVLDPSEQCPAGVVADRHIRAAYDDPQGLAELAQLCRAVTTEFENVPAESLRILARD